MIKVKKEVFVTICDQIRRICTSFSFVTASLSFRQISSEEDVFGGGTIL